MLGFYQTAPNGNMYADATVNTLAHEIGETVTDPDISAWGSQAVLDEVGDKCNYNFSETHRAPNGVLATAQVGSNYYYIQKLWTNVNGGGCYSGYSTPAAVIWQQGTGGAVAAWKMTDQNNVAAYLSYGGIAGGQNVIAVGDFSDGLDPQVLTTGPSFTGPVTMTTLHADSTSTSSQMFSSLDANTWKIVSTKDINGDGFGDIIFKNVSTADVWLYLMQGTTVLNAQHLGIFSPWVPAGAADFNGDGLADIYWIQSGNPSYYTIWTTSVSGGSVSFTGFQAISFYDSIVGAADVNGDGTAELLHLEPNGDLYVDYFSFPNNTTLVNTSEFVGGISPGQYRGLADANRDGQPDVVRSNQWTGI